MSKFRTRKLRRRSRMVLRTGGKFKVNHQARHGRSGKYRPGGGQ